MAEVEIKIIGKFEQNLKAVGTGSHMVIIPKAFMHHLGWEPMCRLVMELDYSNKRVNVFKAVPDD